MTPRDWLEAGWHSALLLLAVPPVLDFLRSHRWARVGLVIIVAAALGYHLAVVRACDLQQALCYWGHG